MVPQVYRAEDETARERHLKPREPAKVPPGEQDRQERDRAVERGKRAVGGQGHGHRGGAGEVEDLEPVEGYREGAGNEEARSGRGPRHVPDVPQIDAQDDRDHGGAKGPEVLSQV